MTPRLPASFATDLRRPALALGIGAGGGALFAWFELPLAWMIGAMCLTTASALAGAPIKVPAWLGKLMMAVLGVMLGGAFRPDMIEHVGQWGVTLAGMLLYLVVVSALTWAYFRRVAGYDRITAYFSGIPGGLAEMIMIGGAMGGDDRKIALTHAARVLLVVLVIPYWFRVVEGYQPAPGALGAALATFSALDLAVLASCGIAGFGIGRALGLPAPAVIGPMALSAAAHVTGLTDSKPPSEIIVIAQVVLGTGVGCRFADVPVRHVLRAIAMALGSTALMLTICIAFSVALNTLSGVPTIAIVLALAPGGLAEMSLIALALGVDPAFVSTHHVLRILVVVVLAPLAFKALARTHPRN